MQAADDHLGHGSSDIKHTEVCSAARLHHMPAELSPEAIKLNAAETFSAKVAAACQTPVTLKLTL